MDISSLPLAYACLILLGASFISSGILIYLFRFLFQKAGIMDHPERYPHEGNRKPIPYGLWVVLFVNFALLSLIFLDLSYRKLIIILVLGVIISTINFIDDLDTVSMSPWKLSPTLRLVFQFIIGVVIGITSIKIGYISNLFWGILYLDFFSISLGSLDINLIPLIFTMIWYVLVFNSLNWSDGVPGMTSGVSFVSLLIITVLTTKLYLVDDTIASRENSVFVLSLVSILAPSVLLFWIFDIKRKFLIGDSGTMFLAFMIATLAIISGGKIATVATVLGVYLIDAFYVIFMRLYNKENPLKGDHIHHLHFRLGKLGFSKWFIRWLVYSLSFLFGMAAIFLDKVGKVILFFIMVVIVFFITKILSLKR